MPRFRILSLDGGGIRGAFTAAVLARIEQETRKSVSNYFDLITGTSTGGIIALGLGLGLSATEILDFYRIHGPTIFPGMGVLQRTTSLLRQLVAPKRSREALRNALLSVFGERRLGESKTRLVLPCYDAVGGRIYVLKTAHHPRITTEFRALAVDCALATAAAPTYFEASVFPEHPGAQYLDGGVWANCPALVGVIEAIHFLQKSASEIDVLTIGTVSQPFAVSAGRRLGGIFQWNAGLVELTMRGQAESALAMAKLLLSGAVYRIDATACPGRFAMDDARGIRDLIALGDGEGRNKANLEAVTERFVNSVGVEPFVSLAKMS
jgi:hypothetical protein